MTMRPLAQPGRFRIRQAAMEDLADAVRARNLAWRQSYPLTEDDFARRETRFEAQVEAWQHSAANGCYFWVVVDTADNNRIVGVANARAADDPQAPTTLELQMMYLLDVAKGSGIADRLLEMTIGDAPAHLWVVDGNDRAIAFYRRHGFEPVGGPEPAGMGLPEGVTKQLMVRG